MSNYRSVFSDFRFLPAVANVLIFMAIWIQVMIVGALGLARCMNRSGSSAVSCA